MMEFNWKTAFADKVMTAIQATKLINAGDHIFIGTGCAEPQVLVRALVDASAHLADTELYHLLTSGIAPYAEPQYADRFRFNTFFVADNVRSAVHGGFGDYTPVFLSEIPKLFDSGRIPLDVALIQVTPPDRNGLVNLGVSVDIVRSAIRNAVVIIAQVNDRMPRTRGDTLLHVHEIDALVEGSEELPETVFQDPTPVVKQIARHLAKLIDDGATVQVGIGKIPQALLTFLKDKKDIGIHTEMFTDGIIDLIEAGVITGLRKTINPGKIVASFAMGSQRLWDYIDDNPIFEFHPTEYVNDPYIIGKLDDMIAVNVGIEVDLTGQVCSDSLGTQFYSGFGGQVDFIRGAARSNGGKPIIAIPSTTKDGKASRISATLKDGAGVVTTRGDVHYVVTEYGIAYLHGKCVRERAMALIQIAHPKFRMELLRQAKEANYIYQDQSELPWNKVPYPEELETTMVLSDGTEVQVRPVKPTDEEPFKDLFYSLSDQSKYLRFFSRAQFMPHGNRQTFVNVNYNEQVAPAVVVDSADGERAPGLGQYIKVPNQPRAEVAFLVGDEWQHKGLGSKLMDYLIRIARQSDLKGFEADVLVENQSMLSVFEGLPFPVEMKIDSGSYHIKFNF